MSLQSLVDFVESIMCGKDCGLTERKCVRIKGHDGPCRDNAGDEYPEGEQGTSAGTDFNERR